MPRTYAVLVTLTDEDFADYGTDREVMAYLDARLSAFPSPTSEAVPQRVVVLPPDQVAYVRDCVLTDDGEHAPTRRVGDHVWSALVDAPIERTS